MSTTELLRSEMNDVQAELASALKSFLDEVGNRLSAEELAAIQEEFRELDELLERLKIGMIWITLFGKASVGKSAITNALVGEDLAKVGPEHGTTTAAIAYDKPPWKIVDVPGILDKKVNEQVALEEARKAHGHIFVVDGEPEEPELKLFEFVHGKSPQVPRLVFVNKADLLQSRPTKDRERIKAIVNEKMLRFVRSPLDIIWGSAQVFDPANDTMVRQELPQLLDRLYEGAGTLAQVISILDPANRAYDLSETVRKKVLEIRIGIARKVIKTFAMSSVAGGIAPFSSLTVSPGILGSMVFVIFRIMGVKKVNQSVAAIGSHFLKVCMQTFGLEFVAFMGTEVLSDTFEVLVPIIGSLITVVALSRFRYTRATLLGELAIEYTKNDCSWGGESPQVILSRCKERASKHYAIIRTTG